MGRIGTAAVGLALLSACGSACDAVAKEECPDWGAFVQACAEEWEEAGVVADCYPDPKGLADYLEENPEDWSGARDEGLVEDCTSARQAEKSCEAWSSEKRSRMDEVELEDIEAECEQDLESVDEWEQAMIDKDCQYVIDLFGG